MWCVRGREGSVVCEEGGVSCEREGGECGV